VMIASTQIATFTRRLDVLPGDVNDDGAVNTTDGVLILYNPTPAHPYKVFYDINGDGIVDKTDFVLYRPFIGTVLPSLPPQLAAGGEGPGAAAQLTRDELAPIVTEAVEEWAAAGLPAADVARLDGVTATIAALPTGYLGGAAIGGNTIYLSADAAGYGWFIDRAPATIALSAAPAGREDLLTVVMHELGHVLGLNDVDPTTFPDDLMAETLATGVRRLPSAQDVIEVVAEQRLASKPVASGIAIADAVFGTALQDRFLVPMALAGSGTLAVNTDHAASIVVTQSRSKCAGSPMRNAVVDALFDRDH
jgi:hypothetical protein